MALRVGRRTLMAQGLAVTAAAFLAESGSENLHNAAIDLRFNSVGRTFISGSVGGRRANMTGSYFGSTITGSLHGVTLKAQLAEKDQSPHGSGFVTTTRLTGTMGGQATSLVGLFTTDARFLFEHGTVTGTHAGKKVRVSLTPNASFDSVGYAANVKGTFGSTKLALVANLPGAQRGTVTGSVGGKKIHLTRTSTGTSAGVPSTRLTGTYSGPVDLLALLLGTISYFGG
jgi:hypothetical protein